MKAQSPKPFELTGRHVLFAMVAFFAVIIAVQAVFITVAIATHTGVVSRHTYSKGLHYGDRIAVERAQEKLGWHETLTVPKDKRSLTIYLTDQYGKPVVGLKLAGKIGRPVTMAEDRALSFSPIGKGSYKARLPDKMAGAYITDINASDSTNEGEILWRFRKRLWLKP